MAPPARTIDSKAVEALAAYAGLALPDERVDPLVEALSGEVIPDLEQWRAEHLGFWFEGGSFNFVRPSVAHRAPSSL